MEPDFEIAEEVNKKIEKEIEGALEACSQDIQEQGGFNPLLVLYDDKGQGIIPPFRIGMFLARPEIKHMFVPMMKKFVDFLRNKEDVHVVKSVIFQCVYYAKKSKGDFANEEEYVKKYGSVSQDPDADEAIMVLCETKTAIESKVYPTIYDDQGSTGVVSKTPENDMSFNKSGKDTLSSWMIGFLD